MAPDPDDLAIPGWNFPLGILAVVLTAAAVSLVVDRRDQLYEWRKRSILLALPGLMVAACALGHLLRPAVWWDMPYGHHGPGGYVTLAGGLLMLLDGLLLLGSGYLFDWPDPGSLSRSVREAAGAVRHRPDDPRRGYDWWDRRS